MLCYVLVSGEPQAAELTVSTKLHLPATEPGNSLKLHNIYNNLKSTLIAILA